MKDSIQKQLLTEQVFFEIDVLKYFAILRGKNLCWSVFLIKLHACNFPVNIAKFFHKTSPVAASKKSINFPENISDGGVIDLSFY